MLADTPKQFPPRPDGVYLLHFEKPYKHAAHYCGYSPSIEDRIEEHRSGHGARLTQVIKQAGIGFVVARVWFGKGRGFERKLKNRCNSSRFCPVCRGSVAFNSAKD